MASIPTGTVTFLFSDIEGSTRLLHRFGDLYTTILHDHRTLMRRAFEAYGGYEVGTEGDSFFVAFHRAIDAVAAAADAQQALHKYTWPQDASVHVRIGIHTGEPSVVSGEYTGIDVHRAARVCSAAHGGQTLLSHATRNLVQNDSSRPFELLDMGEHRLKDLDHPEHLYQLLLPGLQTTFPPLRTLTVRAGNLPLTATPLVGRDRELDTLQRMLKDGARLVSLTGPGGAGKTRLAIELGRSAVEAFDDGIHFVPLAPLSDATLIALTIVQTLGIPAGHGDPLVALKEYLGSRKLLLILDNFEQLMSGAKVVAELLEVAPDLRIVVTSREVLRLRGEREFPVPSLALPDRLHEESFEKLSQYAAVALFIQRASEVRPDFVIDKVSAPAVAEICHRLDGLPLAIELAAARIKLFSPDAMLARLGRPLELLRGGARDLPDRHQTLRGAITWSYDLLEEAERTLFRRISIFNGGCTLDAIEAICKDSGGGTIDVLDGVTALVDKSLLRREEGTDGEPRFQMLETIREFGLGMVEQEGEEEKVHSAHVWYYLALAEEAQPHLLGPQQTIWLDRLDADRDNLRAALRFLIDERRAESALRLGAALWRYWLMRGNLGEGRKQLEILREIGASCCGNDAWVRVLNALGIIAQESGDIEGAVEILEEIQTVCRCEGNRAGLANALTHLGWARGNLGEIDVARAMTLEALEIYEQLGDQRGIATAIQNLGVSCTFKNDFEEGRRLLQLNFEHRRELGDLRGIAYALDCLAILEWMNGWFDEGLRLAEEGLAIIRKVNDRQVLAELLSTVGSLASELGDLDRGMELLEQSKPFWLASGNPAGDSYSTYFIAVILIERGDYATAYGLLTQVLGEVRAIRGQWIIATVLNTVAHVHHRLGKVELAKQCYEEARELTERIGLRVIAADALFGLGNIAYTEGRLDETARLFAEGQAILDTLDMTLSRRQQLFYGRALAALQGNSMEDVAA